jgi:hypothetical protein
MRLDKLAANAIQPPPDETVSVARTVSVELNRCTAHCDNGINPF